jgi:DNA-binding NtrC family response regulator
MLARVLLAIDNPPLQRRVKKRLELMEVATDVIRSKRGLWERVGHEVCDLIVVSRSRIPSPVSETIQVVVDVPDGPCVIVLAPLDNHEDIAALQAAGCQAVIDPESSLPALLEVIETALSQRRDRTKQRIAARRLSAQPRLSDFVSRSPTMAAFMRVVERVVPSDISLLLLGETGVGKERLAQAIHASSPRASGPFIAVNCGALPESLLESELFGHQEGAFTGASRARRGCFELAHGGTVFLDEIGDLPLHLQVKLLRVLQEREVRRLGGEATINVDVRIMAATNRNLEHDVDQKLFRRDLYYRLGVMTLEIPPLRERREDIPDLVENFIAYLRSRMGVSATAIAQPALLALARYRWPGNVRELLNVIERALLLATGDTITCNELPTIIGGVESGDRPSNQGDSTLDPSLPQDWLTRPWKEVRRAYLKSLERRYLAALLEQCDGRRRFPLGTAPYRNK